MLLNKSAPEKKSYQSMPLDKTQAYSFLQGYRAQKGTT